MHLLRTMVVLFIVVLLTGDSVNAQQSTTTGKQTLNVLFIGNSYTARHNLSDVVKAMAEERNPNLTFNPTTVIYGGRTLSDHWAMGTQNIVSLHSLTKAQQESTVAALEKALGKDPDNRHAKTALTRHQKLLKQFESGEFERTKWDWVVLQSYRDDLEGDKSLYARFAPKFTELAKAQGAHVLLYETTPTTQNAEPLTALPDAAPVKQKANEIAALADRIGASVAPISQIAHRCQSQRPDLTLRFVNDAHLNQTLAYLTACTIYAAIFERSPEGLTVTSVTDIRFLNNDRKSQKDRDGKPITTTFSGKDRADLQRIAWEGYVAFKKLRSRKLP